MYAASSTYYKQHNCNNMLETPIYTDISLIASIPGQRWLASNGKVNVPQNLIKQELTRCSDIKPLLQTCNQQK